MNNLQIVLYIISFIFLCVVIYMYMTAGRPMKVVLYRWVNKKRVFDGVYNGKIKKRFSDGFEEQLMIPSKPKIWCQVPESSFCQTNMKGVITTHVVIDNTGNHYFIKPDDTLFVIKNNKVQEALLDEKNDFIFEEVYVKDENGEILYEPQFNADKSPMVDENGQQIFKPKIEMRQKFQTIEKQYEEPVPFDRVIENDVKLYFLNKKEELRQKYKKDEKKSVWAMIAPFIIIGLIVIVVVYMSYKYMQEAIIKESNDRKTFFETLTKKIVNGDFEEKKTNEPSPIPAGS